MSTGQLGQIYQPQSPLGYVTGDGGQNALATVISGKNQEAQTEAAWRNANPEKTVGAGIVQGASGAAAGASIASATKIGGSAGGAWGAGIGFVVGALGYALS